MGKQKCRSQINLCWENISFANRHWTGCLWNHWEEMFPKLKWWLLVDSSFDCPLELPKRRRSWCSCQPDHWLTDPSCSDSCIRYRWLYYFLNFHSMGESDRSVWSISCLVWRGHSSSLHSLPFFPSLFSREVTYSPQDYKAYKALELCYFLYYKNIYIYIV